MHQKIIGWDIGGAHVKAVVLEPDGIISRVFQLPCPLWKGIDYLNQAVSNIRSEISNSHCIHSVTMTGELVDLFACRDQGVGQIIETMKYKLKGNTLYIYAGNNGFLSPEQIRKKHYASIASANWLASATLAATKLKSAVFIDIGSTTTDILTLADHSVQPIGLSDFDRMISDELVYTGIIRTAVMAVAQSAFFNGVQMGLMAEYFATMADVYRLTGELKEVHDQTDTADGAEKTKSASGKRLSRMTGYEYFEKDLHLWKQFAQNIKSQQKNKIRKAIERQLSRNLISKDGVFVGAGVGRFLVKQMADELGYSYVDFTDLFEYKLQHSVMDIADCAPAAAVALLAATTLPG